MSNESFYSYAGLVSPSRTEAHTKQSMEEQFPGLQFKGYGWYDHGFAMFVAKHPKVDSAYLIYIWDFSYVHEVKQALRDLVEMPYHV